MSKKKKTGARGIPSPEKHTEPNPLVVPDEPINNKENRGLLPMKIWPDRPLYELLPSGKSPEIK